MGFIIGYLVLAVNPVGRYIFEILLFNIDMRDVTESLYVLCFILRRSYRHDMMLYGEVGGWGRDPKKCTGRNWGMGSSTIQ